MEGEENRRLRDMVLEIDDRGEDLTESEIDFIANLIDTDAQVFTKRQASRIRLIHEKRL